MKTQSLTADSCTVLHTTLQEMSLTGILCNWKIWAYIALLETYTTGWHTLLLLGWLRASAWVRTPPTLTHKTCLLCHWQFEMKLSPFTTGIRQEINKCNCLRARSRCLLLQASNQSYPHCCSSVWSLAHEHPAQPYVWHAYSFHHLPVIYLRIGVTLQEW